MSLLPPRLHMSRLLLPVLALVALSAAARGGEQNHRLEVTVFDENGLAVASARLTLTRVETQTIIKGETDYAGRCVFSGIDAGAYRLKVEKEGFYIATVADVRAGETERVEIVLNHHLEFSEYMDVTYSAPAVDPDRTAATETLGSSEIINLPYPISRDIRSLLPFIPGVVRDFSGNVHVNGSSAGQILSKLDGFNITHPVSGLFDLRVSADALRSIEVLGSRYSAEHGKGSGGVLALATRMGDDRYRFSATNFIPSVQTRKGLAIDNWTPRATVSGPIYKKRAWFFDAGDAEYNLDIVNELPAGADRSNSWRLGNITKAQVNLSQSNILTASFLINSFYIDHLGLTRFTPLETTREASRTAWLYTVKNQSYFSKGVLLEIGMSVNQFRTDEEPLGQSPFRLTPEGASGNHFETDETYARRAQFIANVIAPPVKWLGRHEVRIGADADHIA
ncbi:MAG TPA: carboxypeptidase-like regulatory domain-containing protein, partial [Blastocatellia bacterium]|nr:carboxypeptidase-like regulatory domain-containing protein [Blastocatellia bacterium]